MGEIKLPKGERGMVRYFDFAGNERFILTTKDVSGYPNFYLYEVSGDGIKRLGSGRNPLELEEKFEVERLICDGKNDRV